MTPESTALLNVGDADLSALLNEMESKGEVTLQTTHPSLNKVMIEKGAGSVGFFKVLDYQVDAIESTLKEGATSDLLVLQDFSTDEKFTFFAGNKGLKGKIRSFHNGDFIGIYYAGAQASEKKGYNDWHDFKFMKFANQKALENFISKTKEKLKK